MAPDIALNNAIEGLEEAERFNELIQPLSEDVNLSFDLERKEPNGYNRRATFRVAFSAIEGIISSLKSQILSSNNAKSGAYSDGEIAMLKEENYQLDGRGIVMTKPAFSRVADNMIFTWKMLVRPTDPDYRPDLSDEGWRCLLSSISVRNRITHPRYLTDLDISDKEVRELHIAYAWFLATSLLNVLKVLEAMRTEMFEFFDTSLPDTFLEWLDEIRLKYAAELGEVQDYPKSLSLPKDEVREEVVAILLRNHLGILSESQVILNKLCSIYIKRRSLRDSANC